MDGRDLEKTLIETLLKRYALGFYARSVMAPLIAAKAFESRHLYEDMGFKSRVDFNRFMSEHYPELAKMRPKEKRWKKFLFDSIDSVAPACQSCPDTSVCFSCDVFADKVLMQTN